MKFYVSVCVAVMMFCSVSYAQSPECQALQMEIDYYSGIEQMLDTEIGILVDEIADAVIDRVAAQAALNVAIANNLPEEEIMGYQSALNEAQATEDSLREQWETAVDDERYATLHKEAAQMTYNNLGC